MHVERIAHFRVYSYAKAIKGPQMAPTECGTVKLNLNSQTSASANGRIKIFRTILMVGRRFMNR